MIYMRSPESEGKVKLTRTDWCHLQQLQHNSLFHVFDRSKIHHSEHCTWYCFRVYQWTLVHQNSICLVRQIDVIWCAAFNGRHVLNFGGPWNRVSIKKVLNKIATVVIWASVILNSHFTLGKCHFIGHTYLWYIMEQRWPPRDEISRSRGCERGAIWRITLPVAQLGVLMQKFTTGKYRWHKIMVFQSTTSLSKQMAPFSPVWARQIALCVHLQCTLHNNVSVFWFPPTLHDK
jgi:hypothetical protein